MSFIPKFNTITQMDSMVKFKDDLEYCETYTALTELPEWRKREGIFYIVVEDSTFYRYDDETNDFICLNPSNTGGGYLKLDGDGKVSLSLLPFAVKLWKGNYDPITDTPHLSDSEGEGGDQYICTNAGTFNLGSGDITVEQGDYLIHNGTRWERVPHVGYSKLEADNTFLKKSGGTMTGNINLGGNDLINIDNGEFESVKINGLSSGIVRSNINGELSFGQLMNSDIDNLTITDSKLTTITTSGKVANSATTGTSTSTGNTLVLRDANGAFNAGVITASGLTTGAISTTSINTNNGNITMGSGDLTCDQITAGGSVRFSTLSTGILHSSSTGILSSGLIDDVDITNGTITGAKISNLTITGDKIADGTITNAKLTNLTIGGEKLANTTITGGKLANLTITGDKIADANITGSKITGLTITGDKIADFAITGGKITDGTITGAKLANLTITSDKLADANITGGKIAGSTITGDKIVDSTITGGKITDGTITDNKLAIITTAGKVANSATTATYANTPNAIVARDVNGNISVQDIFCDDVNLTSFYNSGIQKILFSSTNTRINQQVQLSALTTNGLVKATGGNGVLASGLLVGTEITDGTITDNKLSTISTAGKIANSATTATPNLVGNAIIQRNADGHFWASIMNSNGVQINQNFILEFGINRTKELNAGKMGYETFTAGALDIVGAGTSTRTVKIWDVLNVSSSLTAPAATFTNFTASINATLPMYINWGGSTIRRPRRYDLRWRGDNTYSAKSVAFQSTDENPISFHIIEFLPEGEKYWPPHLCNNFLKQSTVRYFEVQPLMAWPNQATESMALVVYTTAII